MSKRELKTYLKSLEKRHLEEQIIHLYERFKDVKVYYDFAFNPNEDKLLEACKIKISNEYFPVNSRRPKARRSVAKKYIRHFLILGVAPCIISDVMLFQIEIAQAYSVNRAKTADTFYKSMFSSFEQAINYMTKEGITNEFKTRLVAIVHEVNQQDWPNKINFERALKDKIK
jgi:hypothetical protein